MAAQATPILLRHPRDAISAGDQSAIKTRPVKLASQLAATGTCNLVHASVQHNVTTGHSTFCHAIRPGAVCDQKQDCNGFAGRL